MTVATGDHGVSFTGLLTGLHRVSFSGGPAGSVAPPPFLVTLPFPNATGGWDTTVNTAPKPATTTITKTVVDAAAHGVGSNVTWTVNAPRPTLGEGQSLTEFRITDALDSRLTFVPGSSRAEFVCPGDPTATRDLTSAAITGTTTLTWNADAADLTFLNTAANAGCSVELTLVTTINAAGTDGVIPNTAQLWINGNANAVNSGTPEVRLGQIVIEKFDATDRDETLPGATFRLFQTRIAAEAYLATPNATTLAAAVTINGENSWTTAGPEGRVTISGVMLTNWLDGATGTRDGWYLVETAAPNNFILLDQVIDISELIAWAPAAAGYTVAVANVPDFQLPAAGGSGAMMIIIGGAAFVVLSVTVGLVSRRKAAATA
jgi:fimbrial isopeptide formation D2 family protein